ncbi:MAG: DUF4253 domain-containing protein [Myxococcales bacterium]|nr:DUF4253 domain-containing protein [Myxococcales bacterium]
MSPQKTLTLAFSLGCFGMVATALLLGGLMAMGSSDVDVELEPPEDPSFGPDDRLVEGPGSPDWAGGSPTQGTTPIVAEEVGASDDSSRDLRISLRALGLDRALLVFMVREGRTIYGLRASGEEAFALWTALRANTQSTGYYPVILGDGSALEAHRVAADPARGSHGSASPARILEEASSADADAWLEAQTRRAGEEFSELPRWPEGEAPIGGVRVAPYAIPMDALSGEPLAHVAVALVPTQHSWEVPAWLAFGGWNDCPNAWVHVALFRRWYAQYGAEVVGISTDAVEMRVLRPPSEMDAAFRLAREHCAYASDFGQRPCESRDGLARELRGVPYWHFWWD